MQRFFILIGILIALGGGFFIVTQNPEMVQNFKSAWVSAFQDSNSEQFKKMVVDKVNQWEPNPEDPPVVVPKNWGREEATYLINLFGQFLDVVKVPDLEPFTPKISW